MISYGIHTILTDRRNLAAAFVKDYLVHTLKVIVLHIKTRRLYRVTTITKSPLTLSYIGTSRFIVKGYRVTCKMCLCRDGDEQSSQLG